MISILVVFTLCKFFCGGKHLVLLKKWSCEYLSLGENFLREILCFLCQHCRYMIIFNTVYNYSKLEIAS